MTLETGADAQNTDKSAAAQQPGNTEPVKFNTVEEALVAFNATKEELDKVMKNLEQSRKEERFNKTERKRLEEEVAKLSKNEALTELQAKYEAEVNRTNTLLQAQRQKLVDAALETALKDAKAKSISTVLKLINRDEIKVENDVVDAKSIEAQVARLRKEDSVLFDELETPSVKRTTEGAVTGSFEKELQAAKTQKDIEQIMRRHGKM